MAAGPLCSLVEHTPGVKPPTRAPTCKFLALPLLLESTNFLLIAYDCSCRQPKSVFSATEALNLILKLQTLPMHVCLPKIMKKIHLELVIALSAEQACLA